MPSQQERSDTKRPEDENSEQGQQLLFVDPKPVGEPIEYVFLANRRIIMLTVFCGIW